MSALFGFHGDRVGDKAMSASMMKMRRRKTMAGPGQQQQQPPANLSNPMLRPPPGNNMMTYNGMYNVASVNPPSLDQRPSRRATSRAQAAQQQQMMSMPQIVAPPLPINSHPTMTQQMGYNNTPSNLNAPMPQVTAGAGNISDLQQKVLMWKQKRRGTQPPPPQQQQQQQQYQQPSGFSAPSDPHHMPGMFDAGAIEDDEEPHDQHQQSQQTASSSQNAGLQQYQTEINMTVDSVRREVQSLRDEIHKLSDTVKLLNPGNQTGVVKMVEQQVQKIVVDQNRVTGVLDQIQLMCKSQQNQIDELTKNMQDGAGGGGINAEEFDEIVEGLQSEQKAAFTQLETQVKTALQTVSDRSYWFYGNVLQDTLTLYESHELNSRKKLEMPRETKVHLTYPMKKTTEGVWMKARTVAEDGSISVAWAPIWTFSPQVREKYGADKQPPAEEEKIIYLGQFSLC
jgi:hypothetical protein